MKQQRQTRIENLRRIVTDPDAMRFYTEPQLEQFMLELELLEKENRLQQRQRTNGAVSPCPQAKSNK